MGKFVSLILHRDLFIYIFISIFWSIPILSNILPLRTISICLWKASQWAKIWTTIVRRTFLKQDNIWSSEMSGFNDLTMHKSPLFSILRFRKEGVGGK